MDIDLFSKMIKELILDNDRVVLPGLGCFVAEMVPAAFSDKGYTINPPYRRLYFRSKPDTDDGLVNFYAESNGLEQDVACRILGDFIAELRTIIFTKKLVVLPGLGRLRATKENNIFFIADEDLDIYPAGFGLEPISLKTHQETQQEVSAAVVGLRSILDEEPVAVLVPEPVQATVEPEPTPEPQQDSEPVQEELPETLPEVEPEQPVETVHEETQESPAETVEESLTEPVQETFEPVQEQEPVIEPEPEHIEEPELMEEPEQQEAQMLEFAPEYDYVERPGFLRKCMIAAGILLAVSIVLLILFVVLSRLVPGLFDSILYTSDELDIINRVL